MTRSCGLIGLLALLATSLAPVSAQDFLLEDEVIDYRKHIMQTMSTQVAIIGMIAEGRAPADDFATHVAALAEAASTAKRAFEFEIEGGDAKPEIWTKWDNFAERMDKLAADTAQLRDVARDGGLGAAQPMIAQALSCKSCHDQYRVKR